MSIDSISRAPVRILLSTLAVLCAFSAIALILSLPFNETVQVEFFSSALREARANETVSVHGTSYRVSLGAVSNDRGHVTETAGVAALRLAYEKTAARNNPLLALPDIDMEVFRDAVASLRSTASQLSARQTRTNQIFSVQHFLYPADFLEELANLEETRRDFLASGSDVDAKRYRLDLLSAIDTFENNRVTFENAFGRAVPSDTPSYGTLKSIISRDDFVSTLNRLGSDAQKVKKVAQSRTACFQGRLYACRPTEIILPELPASPVSPVSAEALSHAERTRDIFVQAGDRFISSQFLLLTKSVCSPRGPGTAPLFSLRDNGDGVLPSPLFVGDILFIESAPYAQLPFYGYFAARDIPYVYLNPLSYYECIGGQTDLGALVALQAVRDFALREDLSARAGGELSTRLERSEKLFASAHIIATTDAERYLRDARTLSESPDFPESVYNDIRSLWLRVRTGSDGILHTIRDINMYEGMNLRFPSEASLDFDAAYIFFARSGFMSLVPDTFRSVSGDGGKMFPVNTLPADAQPYVLLSAIPKDILTTAEAISHMRFFRSLHPIKN